MFDFPASPANGTVVTLPDGTQRVWDGVKWRAAAGVGQYLPLAGGTLTGDVTMTASNFYGAGGIAKPGEAITGNFMTSQRFIVPINSNLAWNAYLDASSAWKYSITAFASRITQRSTQGDMVFTLYPSGTAGTAVGTAKTMTFDQAGALTTAGNFFVPGGIALPGEATDSSFATAQRAIVPNNGTISWNTYYATGNVAKYVATAGAVELRAAAALFTISVSPSGTAGNNVSGTKVFTFASSGNAQFPGGIGFNGNAAVAKPTIAGACAGNTAIKNLLTALASYGLLTDTTSA